MIGWTRRYWLLALFVIAFVAPTLLRLARQSWTMEIGAHGPIVLATGLWLAARQEWRGPAPRPQLVAAAFGVLALVALPIYVFGRAYDFLSLEVFGLLFALLCLLATQVGLRPIGHNKFPLFYLCFLIPPPGWVIDRVTAPLQHFISWTATGLLHEAGYPVARSGVSIEIAQYRLLVEQACSGMNSIVGLTAIALFYIYLLHARSWRYAMVLVALILPIAVFANFLRALVLILTTYYFGDAVAQGVFHNTAGIALFAMALALMFGADALLGRILLTRTKRR